MPEGRWSLFTDEGSEARTSSDYFEGHRNELRHVVDCLRTGEPFAVEVESAICIDEILAEAAVQLQLDCPRVDRTQDTPKEHAL